tara:strand:+ start:1213 stop:3198 length:1986 start_codon:yes stop_codon:yes gene_type:complete
MKWIGTQTLYDSIRLSGQAKNVQIGVSGLGTLALTAGDITLYDATNDGNPTISIGKDASDRLEIKSEYHSGAQTINWAKFTTYSSSGSANAGRIGFYIDETFKGEFRDDGLRIAESNSLTIGSVAIISDSSGTTTLSNIDALDATTESTIETAIDTLANLTSITLDDVNITSMQSSSESFSDNDTSLMTSAAIADKIEAYGYSTTTGDITAVTLTADDTNTITDSAGSADFGIKGSAPISTAVDGTDIAISVANASTSAKGVVELATTAETTTGTDTGRAVTPDGLKDGYQGSSNVTTLGTIGTGVWNGTAIASAYLDSDTAHLSGTQTFSGAKTFSATTTTFTSATADSPTIKILNTTNDSQAARFVMEKDRGAGTNGDNIGELEFFSKDNGENSQMYGKILVEIDEATDGQESGNMELRVASHDGEQQPGLTMTGGSVEDEVDVTIAHGASSVTTIEGTLTMGSTATLNNSGLLQVANQSNITGVGTISSGTWQGTAVATGYTKHLIHYEFKGYGTGDGTNYEIPVLLTDNQAPWEHNTSAGSDGLTAITVQTQIRMGGQTMPRACTLKKWTGWATCGGSATAYIGLFKLTPVRNNNTDRSLVLLKETSFTALGNAKLEDFAETSFTDDSIAAGDILVTGIKCGSGVTLYFTSNIEVEF